MLRSTRPRRSRTAATGHDTPAAAASPDLPPVADAKPRAQSPEPLCAADAQLPDLPAVADTQPRARSPDLPAVADTQPRARSPDLLAVADTQSRARSPDLQTVTDAPSRCALSSPAQASYSTPAPFWQDGARENAARRWEWAQ